MPTPIVNRITTTPLSILALCIVLFVTGAITPSSANALLQAFVDRNTITIEETLTLRVRLSNENAQGQPDFSLLDSQFDILSNHQSSQVSYTNGAMTSFTEWTMMLAPKRSGRLLIPSFKHQGFISDAIEIKVNTAQAAPTGQIRDIFIETLVDKENVYVQEQTLLKYRLYYAVNVDKVDANPLSLDNATVEELEQQNFRRNIKGRVFRIAEFGYAIFPQQSGEIVIPAQTWQVRVPTSQRPRSIFDTGRYEIKRLRTKEMRITVNPKPAAFPSDQVWLPASEVTIAEMWSKDTQNFSVGEPVSRTLKVSAEKLMSSQLPEVLSNIQSSRLKSYIEQPQLNDSQSGSGISGIRTESAAYVVSKSGETIIPAVEIPWWDTDENVLKYARLPERVIKTAAALVDDEPQNIAQNPSSITSNTANDLTNNTDTNTLNGGQLTAKDKHAVVIWKLASLVLFILWVLTMALWFVFAKRKVQEPVTDQIEKAAGLKKLFKQFEQACAKNDALAIKTSLVNWASHYFNSSTPMTLIAIKHQFNHNGLSELLDQLEHSLYGDLALDFTEGLQLASVLKMAIKEQPAAQQKESELTPLYF